MRLLARLQRLEKRVPRPPAEKVEPLDEEWLQLFEAWGHEEMFAHEPDFSQALGDYRQALADARNGDPPFDPPTSFLPKASQHHRFEEWRRPRHYAAVNTAWFWLAEMFQRVLEGVPPVTEAEFSELAGWFRVNAPRLYAAPLPPDLLETGANWSPSLANIYHRLHGGSRQHGAGRVADAARRIKNWFEQLEKTDNRSSPRLRTG